MALKDVGTKLRTLDREAIRERLLSERVSDHFIPERLQDVSRTAQFIAAFLLPFIIIFSFAIIEAIAGVLAGLFGVGDFGTDNGIIGFFVSGFVLLFYVLNTWMWFLWVRTGGFGLFAI